MALIDVPAGRCLLVIDRSVLAIHDTRITAYFHAHGIELAGV